MVNSRQPPSLHSIVIKELRNPGAGSCELLGPVGMVDQSIHKLVCIFCLKTPDSICIDDSLTLN